jgi:outer membrane protein TolC
VSQQARAAYEQAVASYRQSTLGAFQEVEDNLAALHYLSDEAATEDAAVVAARRSLELSTNRYRGGVASYLEVTTAQSAALANERAAADILSRRMTATVTLIRALGGGWDRSQLPAMAQLR